MPSEPADLFAKLHSLGIATETHRHEAVYTVEQSRAVTDAIPGAHSKNLFLKDRKGRLFLVVARHETQIDLKRLHEAIGASGRLSFGSADLLRAVLGVEPGSVTPFAVLNDGELRVTVILDETLVAHDRLNFHPLVNTMTTGIATDDLMAFLKATGHEPIVRFLPEPIAAAAA